jgi:hypothetical protein
MVVWQCAAVVNIKNNEINSTGARTVKSRPFRRQERNQNSFSTHNHGVAPLAAILAKF